MTKRLAQMGCKDKFKELIIFIFGPQKEDYRNKAHVP